MHGPRRDNQRLATQSEGCLSFWRRDLDKRSASLTELHNIRLQAMKDVHMVELNPTFFENQVKRTSP